MKIAVYTIAKNEEQFASRWAASSAGADYRIVLDTGSTDNTIQLLNEKGVQVHSLEISPWRFDTARNAALAFVPEDVDVCISLDLDEVLREGWRSALERAWTSGATLLRHPICAELPDGSEYYAYVGRVHARRPYRWHYALHEVLRPLGRHIEAFSDDFVIEHRTDHSRNKTFYHEMLAQLVAQEPREPLYSFYWVVELFNRAHYRESIAEGERYIRITDAAHGPERAFIRRILVRAHRLLGRGKNVYLPLLYEATTDAPDDRETWCELAEAHAENGNWTDCLEAAKQALRSDDPHKSFRIDTAAWEGKPERLIELSAKKLGIPEDSLGALRGKHL